jgi:hypothetical protein
MFPQYRALAVDALRIVANWSIAKVRRRLATELFTTRLSIEVGGSWTSVSVATRHSVDAVAERRSGGPLAIRISPRGPDGHEYVLADTVQGELVRGRIRGQLFEIAEPADGWLGKTIEIRSAGQPRAGTRAWLMPDEGHEVLVGLVRTCNAQPTLEWSCGPGWRVVGMLKADPQRAIQVAFAPTEWFLGPFKSKGMSVYVDQELGVRSLEQLALAANAVSSPAAFIGERLGVPPDLTMALVPKSQIDKDLDAPGVTLPAETVDLFMPRAEGRRSSLAIGCRVARVWWGGACRLRGPYAKEVEFGLATAIALDWVRSSDKEAELQQALRTIAHTARKKGDSWNRRAGLLQPALSARVALRAYDALQGHGGWKAIESLSSECWGRYVPMDTVPGPLNALGFHASP